ncbi:hypothetical protein [Paraburkholderia sp. SG-MS1]|uniref:hypothetical protein n=1 Tax=Paraburkholderia sp. SG-MS1 TaxID=2023741 RepID=UPI001445F84D|nr:hypothetical protein [Paraburkholderia sp. SG-MS1]
MASVLESRATLPSYRSADRIRSYPKLSAIFVTRDRVRVVEQDVRTAKAFRTPFQSDLTIDPLVFAAALLELSEQLFANFAMNPSRHSGYASACEK